MNINTLEKLINTVIEYAVNYGFQALGAVLVLGIGLVVANWVARLLTRAFQKQKLDVTLAGFLTGCVRIVILGFAVIIALGKFGITITPFIAALSAVAFGASFAIQGPLSNYGAGLSIIMGRPFVVGDTIAVANVSGLVQEIKLACTILATEDGVQVAIPNKDIVGEIIHNSKQFKLVQGAVGISYGDQPERAIGVIQEVLARFEGVATKPKPQVGVQEFADSAITIAYRFWVPTAKYHQVMFAVNLAIFKAFGEARIPIPYPQMEVRTLSQANV